MKIVRVTSICVNAGNPYLSGSAACNWYFNPVILEVVPYYNRYVVDTCVQLNLTPGDKMLAAFSLGQVTTMSMKFSHP
jgi:hypothetical protein